MGILTQSTDTDVLQAELDRLLNAKAEREKAARGAELLKQIEAEQLDARAEAIADRLAELIGKRGVDFDVVRGGGRIMAFQRSPGPAWEKFQRFVSKLITDGESVPAHEYRNLAKSCLVRPDGEEFAELCTREQFEEVAKTYPALAPKIVNTYLHDLAEGGAKRRSGK